MECACGLFFSHIQRSLKESHNSKTFCFFHNMKSSYFSQHVPVLRDEKQVIVSIHAWISEVCAIIILLRPRYISVFSRLNVFLSVPFIGSPNSFLIWKSFCLPYFLFEVNLEKFWKFFFDIILWGRSNKRFP